MSASESAAPVVQELPQAGRIAMAGDNVAIAVRRLERGTRILLNHLVFELSHTVLEGHRFALHRINKGEALLSWGLPFGMPLRPIEPGEYVCNEKIMAALAERQVEFELPTSANFADYRPQYRLEEASFRPGSQVALAGERFFSGYPRSGTRGVGTRNYILVLGTSSRTAAMARQIAEKFKGAKLGNVDGVVAVEHTEGGGTAKPQNLELTLRALAGFMVHPNAAAVLAVDYGNEPVNNALLKTWMEEKNYPLNDVPHRFFSIESSFEKSLEQGASIISGWLGAGGACERVKMPVANLKVALQCGGSDAFSGISGNPLAGILAREIVGRAGSANLAETSELIGAESYVLANVRDIDTAKHFLEVQRRFEEWAAAHGHSAEGNPSGGNMYRGLYNITIKSIGAARKKDPAMRLDYVQDYAARMEQGGFYFMDSPGNDLESIAGQVAAGCNVILFVTGNGSITNFPFVPTIKIMTTSNRFELVKNEMDFNAGRYLAGEPMEKLGAEAFDLMLEVASGRKSAGERAGHSQVQLWREWRGGGGNPSGGGGEASPARIDSGRVDERLATAAFAPTEEKKRVALVLPTSLCAGQVARLLVERLNVRLPCRAERAVALPHTEGCGNSGGDSERIFTRVMVGHLTHPMVGQALLLEHGCEKTHNDAFRNVLRARGLPHQHFGWASVQMDGGIDKVLSKGADWFERSPTISTDARRFGLGLVGRKIPENVLEAFDLLMMSAVRLGARVVVPEDYGGEPNDARLLDYAVVLDEAGVFKMSCPTEDLVERITGICATGVRFVIAYEDEMLVPANPIVPLLQVSTRERLAAAFRGDVDLVISESEGADEIANQILGKIIRVREGREATRSRELGNTGFQVTRGLSGISL